MKIFQKAIQSSPKSHKKIASDTTIELETIPMVGKLVAKTSGDYVTLEVAQDFADSVFDAIYETGMEKPEHRAHISVMNSDETEKLDMPLEEDGLFFHFTLGEIESCDPEGWDEMEKVWFIKCKSPELEELRKKYGFSPLMFDDHNFHITLAVKPVQEKNEDLVFKYSSEAIQYLSNLTGKRIIIQ